MSALRDVSGTEEQRVQTVADQLGLHPRQVTIALAYAAEHQDEIERRITANERALEEAERAHDAVTPLDLGAHNLPDLSIVELAAAQGRVIATENAQDFAHVTSCPIVFVRRSWWPTGTLVEDLAASLDRWAADNPEPGHWPHWLTETYRS